jgi:DNA-binding CsgD family transcriptional regulator
MEVVASRTDGATVHYYNSLHDALAAVAAPTAADIAAAVGMSLNCPDEITLLADVVLDAPLIVDNGVHIRLVVNGGDLNGDPRTIRRSTNNISLPIIWIKGDSASLCLGKPDMKHELIIDGGYLNSAPIEAHAPLIALSGLDAKLIMYDKVTLQNNMNNGAVPTNTYYQNGSGVYIRTRGEPEDRWAEFIMKGGTIRGNINNTQNVIASGGGVFIHAFGIFTMEGGSIMNNTAYYSGGGVHILYEGCSFKKTGGIIYGAKAPSGFRNTAITGLGTARCYGHALGIAIDPSLLLRYRDDTVGENDNLSYTGNPQGSGIFGKGEKWNITDNVFRRIQYAIIQPILALAASVVFILRKRYIKKQVKEIQEVTDATADATASVRPKIDLESMVLSDRERKICELLLAGIPLKEIATILDIGYSGAHKSAQKLYEKLGIKNRMELLVRVSKE